MDEVVELGYEALGLIAQQGGIGEGLVILLFFFAVATGLVLWIAYMVAGAQGVFKIALYYPALVAWKVLKFAGFHGGRGAIRGIQGLRGATRPRLKDPETDELVERRAIIPDRTPMIQELKHGYHYTPAGLVKAVHMGTISEAGGGKGQTVVNYQIQFQLQYSPENLIILEVKPNLELSEIVYAYARPGDRIWEYSFQAKDRFSSSIAVTDVTRMRDVAHSLTYEKDSKDPHWNNKSEELIPNVALAISEFRREAEEAAARFAGADGHHGDGLVATLNDVRDAVVDRRKLEELCDVSPAVDNVSDSDKEWGYIRSTASRHLSALSEMRVRRVFAGRDDTPQPMFDGYPDGGRDIIIVRPDEASAARESRYVVALLDILIRRAVQAGHAGRPGTKAILDEFASFMDLSKMRRYLDLGRGGKLQVSYVLQGRDQLAAAVGKTEADSIIASTEIKCIGATSDTELAELIAKLSGRRRVEFRGARQGDGLMGDWRDDARHNVEPGEILSQQAGQWIVVHRSEVNKAEVPERCYHHTQAALPREHPLWGVVDPEEYKIPPLLKPKPDEDDEDENGDALVSGARYDDDIPDEGPPEEDDDDAGDDWIS